MARGSVRGIVIEIGGDTTKLETALKSVNTEIKNTESKLKDVNKLLKMDPGNTNLLSQKYKTLQTEIKATKEKLDTLKEAAKQADQALADGKKLCIPLCKAPGEMDAKVIRSLTELQPGAYGIPEPPGNAETILPSEIDLAVIPCLTAAKNGKRLGKGGGYYDRFLSEYTGKAVLLCPERLLLRDIPTEPHDVQLPKVITENAEQL